MVAVFVLQHGQTTRGDRVDPSWLRPGADVRFWVDISAPGEADVRLLADVFAFHPLSIESARQRLQFPKVEQYEGYLYLVLHGIDFKAKAHRFATHDVDFFLGPNYLVTVHDGSSRSISHVADICQRHDRALAEGPAAVLHRIVDAMVDNYQPEMDTLEARIAKIEEEAFAGREMIVEPLLRLKRDLSMLRRIVVPQRDVVGRLGRREFSALSDEMSYRFRDVYDHVVRIADDAVIFQDRVNGILEVHLAAVSNRLNEVMKVLTVMSTIFLPLTVLTSMWGMNLRLPGLPGGEAMQFWWLVAMMGAVAVVMLGYFKRKGWL